MFKYDGSARCKAFEWEGDLQARLERAGELRNQLWDAIAAYAKAREEEQTSWR